MAKMDIEINVNYEPAPAQILECFLYLLSQPFYRDVSGTLHVM